ncbi:hypothetical protein [Variovorax boronicumulans]|uniref:hypothetical protein n=1 Tax=Variovorax boronicumulans TaxID=436515 RepID=UPI00278ADE4F|nr:hypothetical protein [Variovorax boronicumulans]MDQ0042700.1 hypothetical protein [Variovorax boronicumulans]
MDDYIFFSKSNWHEAPRLRHQVAELIRKFGGRIQFFQKPSFVWKKYGDEGISQIDASLTLARTRQLIHHQLRVFPVLRWLNAIVEKKSIQAVLGRNLSRDSVIINFNYDYYFLRDIFPNNRIITIINDDFVAQAKLFSGRHARESLRRTCRNSDLVLTVSYPLMQQVSEWCSPKLFFPWADVEYREPAPSRTKNAVLLWAHIDGRVDFDLLRQSISKRPDVIFYIVGPQASNVKEQVLQVESAANVVIVPSAKLDELPLENFFAAIIPYKKRVADIEAVTMSNKSLQLMSRGLPIVAHGMPAFYEHSAIVKAEDLSGFLAGLDYFEKNFWDLQNSIRTLVSENQPKNRFEFLKVLLSKIEAKV